MKDYVIKKIIVEAKAYDNHCLFLFAATAW